MRIRTHRVRSVLQTLFGAWVNRKHTRLMSSFLIGVIPTLGLGAIAVISYRLEGGADGMLLTIILLNFVFYPITRELYYRLTHPIREGTGVIFLYGPLLIVAVVVRLWIYIILWVSSFMLGTVAWLYLGSTEATGHGYRLRA